MSKIIISFITKILIFTAILALAGIVLFTQLFSKYYFTAFPFLFIVFPSISIIVHNMLLKASKKRPAQFNASFMGSFMIKLFAYSAFVGIMLLVSKVNFIPFILTTLFLYLFYTIFDTVMLLKDLQKAKEL